MTRRMWACEDCGWEWPYPTEPPEEAECDSCGGPLEKVSEVFVATIDALNEGLTPGREIGESDVR